MQDTLNIRQLVRQLGDVVDGKADFNFENRDFSGFSTAEPITFSWHAVSIGDAVRLDLTLEAVVTADCVRCLTPFSRQETIEKTYDIRLEDLEGEYPEYPASAGGQLDLEELAYGELVLEVSPVMVCQEDCPGLCDACGKPQASCTCPKEAPKDPRWQALWGLLEEEEAEDTPAAEVAQNT